MNTHGDRNATLSITVCIRHQNCQFDLAERQMLEVTCSLSTSPKDFWEEDIQIFVPALEMHLSLCSWISLLAGVK